MTWMLDTNACVRYLNGRSPSLIARLDAVEPSQICVCSVVKAELFFGAAQCRDVDNTIADQRLFLARFPSLPFTMRPQNRMPRYEPILRDAVNSSARTT